MTKPKTFKEKYEGYQASDLAKKFVMLRDRHTELKEQAAVIWHEVDYLRFDAIPEALETENVESIKVKGVGRVGTRIEASCKTIDKALLRQWLLEHEAEELISEAINASSLKAFIAGRIRDGQDIPGSEIIEFKPFVVATVTKG